MELKECATLEPEQKPANDKLKLPYINTENAKAIGKLGAEARIRQQIELKQALAKATAELELLRPLVQQQIAKPDGQPANNDDLYRVTELARTRKGLDGLWSDFSSTKDPKERKFLSDAIARLSDVEFALAKRPKPAAYRTAPEKPKRSQASTGPVED